MYLVLWEYEVKPECVDRFERFYGCDGDWVQLFRTHPEFQRSILVKDPVRANVYLTLDFWNSRAAYELFKQRCAESYQALDETADGFTIDERHLGAFEQV